MRYSEQTYQITIENYTQAQDSVGAEVRTWSTYSTPYASIKYGSGQERLEGARDTATTRALFRVQYDSDTKSIDTQMRILFDSVYWDIESVIVVGRNEVIEIMAQKKV